MSADKPTGHKLRQAHIVCVLVLAVAAVGAIAAFLHRHHHSPTTDSVQTASQRTSQSSGNDHQSNADEAAMAELEVASRESPLDKQVQWKLADFYITHGVYDRAVDQLKVVIKLDPGSIEARVKLGDSLLLSKQYDASESEYRYVTQKAPKNLQARQGLCASLIKEHRFFEATTAGKHALDLNPGDDNSRLLHANALLDFALQFSDPRGHSPEIHLAQAELTELTKTMPKNGEIYYQRGRAAQALFQRDESIQNLEKAHELLPDRSDVARTLAISYRAMNRDDKALKLMQDMLAKQPDAAPTNDMLGQLLLDSSDPQGAQKAVEALKKALRASPRDVGTWERLGTAYEKTHNLPDARLVYEHVTQLNPNKSFAFQKLALIYTRLGETKLAKQAADCAQKMTANEQQLKTVLELSSKHPNDVSLHLVIADRYQQLNNRAAAREEYLVVLQMDPNNNRVPKQYRGTAFPKAESKTD